MPYAANGTAYYTVWAGHDVLGRPKSKTTPQANGELKAIYSYNKLTTTIDTEVTVGPALNMSRSYNSLNQLVETVDALEGVTSYVYSGGGSPIVIKDAVGNRIIAKYDQLGRKEWVDDPNQGFTAFQYNAFGELESETNGNNQTTTYTMDTLGRVTVRNSDGNLAVFKWDTVKTGLPSYHEHNGVKKSFTYDDLGRPLTTTIAIAEDNKTFTTTSAYDQGYGRLKSLEYPNGLKVGYQYNAQGYLQQEFNTASGYIYREINAQDVLGNTTYSCLAGNAGSSCDGTNSGFYLVASNLHDLKSGQMLYSQAIGRIGASTGVIHNRQYKPEYYDSYGNLQQQDNGVEGLEAHDEFKYDKLHRLIRSTLTVGNTEFDPIEYDYDAVGNFLYKTDYSNYGSVTEPQYAYKEGTNQITSVNIEGGQVTFEYDNAGNQIKRNGTQEVWYNTFNKPTKISRLGAEINFTYGADLSRYKQVKTNKDDVETVTYYIDKHYEVVTENNKTTQRAYISDVAIVSEEIGEDNSGKIRFTLRDRLAAPQHLQMNLAPQRAIDILTHLVNPKVVIGASWIRQGYQATLMTLKCPLTEALPITSNWMMWR